MSHELRHYDQWEFHERNPARWVAVSQQVVGCAGTAQSDGAVRRPNRVPRVVRHRDMRQRVVGDGVGRTRNSPRQLVGDLPSDVVRHRFSIPAPARRDGVTLRVGHRHVVVSRVVRDVLRVLPRHAIPVTDVGVGIHG